MAGPFLTAAADHRPAAESALASLHYAYPTAVFTFYVVSSAVSVCSLWAAAETGPHPRRCLIQRLMLVNILTYAAQFASVSALSIASGRWLGQQDGVISVLSCILVFGVQFAGLSDSEKPVWYPYIGSYLLALAFEPALLVLSLMTRDPTASTTWFNVVTIATVALRYAIMAAIVVAYFAWRQSRPTGDDSERTPLIQKDGDGTEATEGGEEAAQNASGYGTTTDGTADTNQTTTAAAAENPESPWQRREREAEDKMRKRLSENGNWFAYAKSFVIFVPYIWPFHDRMLQFRAVLVGICLLLNNALNVLIPRQLGIVTDSLTSPDSSSNPWTQVIIFAALKFSASEAGLSLVRQWLWLPVEYYSFDAMSTAAYSHVLRLSSDFHDSKSSSDIMMAIQSGQSVSNLLESICFHAIPMLIDMAVAFVYLSVTFGPYEGLITAATAIIFLYIAGRMISNLRDARRSEISAWFEEHYVRQSGIQGWSTVTSFNQTGHEEQRYSTVVKDRVSKSQAVYLGYLIAYAFQYMILLAGLLAGAFLAVWQVTNGQATPGQFIMLLTYWAQLVAPLNFFAGLGKNISRNLIHAEQLLDIMNTKPTVVNKEHAQELRYVGGAVDFENVCFSYDKKKPILKDISFSVQPGTTVAFVGATGAGKSTILKLLDRFYDVSEGSVKIDGQDIRDVDLDSLRSQIGIVPQGPILFDDTVMNNVRYANLTATDEDIYQACRAACIHDQILTFTDGYQTRVGERGVKLSGGELQRVAIARAILKNPSIVLLDEATSSVDTETERKIQEALGALCQGRTTFVVAHRLSTVMNADTIIVVDGGEIVEQGSHEDLIRAGGRYASLWSQQIFVKPKDKSAAGEGETATSKNVTKIPDLFNDLTPEAAHTELAKVNSATDVAAQGEEASDEQQDDAASSSAHKKEGSKLNPVAPTFTPRSLARAVAAVSDYHVDPVMVSTGGVSPVQKAGGPILLASASPSQSVAQAAACRPLEAARASSQECALVGTSQDADAEVSSSGSKGKSRADKVKWKRPRYSRRVQSKSQPSVSLRRES